MTRVGSGLTVCCPILSSRCADGSLCLLVLALLHGVEATMVFIHSMEDPFKGWPGLFFGIFLVACALWCIVGTFDFPILLHIHQPWARYLACGSVIASWTFLIKFSLRFTESERMRKMEVKTSLGRHL